MSQRPDVFRLLRSAVCTGRSPESSPVWHPPTQAGPASLTGFTAPNRRCRIPHCSALGRLPGWWGCQANRLSSQKCCTHAPSEQTSTFSPRAQLKRRGPASLDSPQSIEHPTEEARRLNPVEPRVAVGADATYCHRALPAGCRSCARSSGDHRSHGVSVVPSSHRRCRLSGLRSGSGPSTNVRRIARPN